MLHDMLFLRGQPPRSVIVILPALFLLFLCWHFLSSDIPDLSGLGYTDSASLGSGLLKNIYNETLGFEKIFVINLPYRTDHRDAMLLSAAVTGLKGAWIDGVVGKEISNKALPPGADKLDLSDGVKGNWRAHLNAIQQVVEQNLESALILEDDADWDIRIKSQMYHFARATHLLSQPLSSGQDRYADPTYPKPMDSSDPVDIYLNSGPPTIEPKRSPYGDNWDLLWLGHCGTRFPEKERDNQLQRGRVIALDDESVPSAPHIDLQFGTNELQTKYPNHTRAIHHTAENVCTLAYAITQKAARQMLYDMGLRGLRGPMDIALREYCDGLAGQKVRNCYTAQPQYFQHHRAAVRKSANSDINSPEKDEDDVYNEKPYTYHIRWSTRMNMEKLVEGETDFEDQWPDDMPGTKHTF